MKENTDPETPYGQVRRRDLLRRWLPATFAGVLLGGTGTLLHGRPGRHETIDPATVPSLKDWRADPRETGRLVLAGGKGPADNLHRALNKLGGIDRFVHEGEKVLLKPNCAWDRTPEQAANTNPELVGELVRLCLEAGAASVTVADSTCHAADRAFDRSGIAQAVRVAGGRIAHQDSAGTRAVDLGGTQLGIWDVLEPLVEADRVINIPIVKHHSLARGTFGMKNWFGALVGNRSRLHQRITQVTAELGHALRPTLTVIDATRILTGDGPTGGSLALVRELDQIAIATDPVAADAWGGSLLDLGPRELPYLDIAVRLGLGDRDWQAIGEAA